MGAWEEVALQWEDQAVAVLLMDRHRQADPWVLALGVTGPPVAQAVVDLQWEALVQAVDLLRWVDLEANLHQLEGQQSHNCSESPLVLKSPSARRLMNVSSACSTKLTGWMTRSQRRDVKE